MNRIAAALLLLAAVVMAACGGDDEPAIDASTAPDALPPRGTISMSWSIESGGAQTGCLDVGAQLVVVEMVRQGEASGEADTFNCAALEATTRQVDAAVYDLRFDLIDAAAQSLLPEPVTQLGIEVNEDGDTPIGEVVFVLD